MTTETQNDIEEDSGSSGLHRPPPARSPARYLCVVVCFPAFILLAVGIALTLWLIALKSNDGDSIPTAPPPSSGELFRFDASSSGKDDAAALPVTWDTPTPNPNLFETPKPSPNVQSPTFSQIKQLTTQSPTLVPTQESIFIKNNRGKFLDILESRIDSGKFILYENGLPETPQFKAQSWLTQDPHFFRYSDDRMIQRWVLATFAFGMMEGTANGGYKNALLRQEGILQIPPALTDWVQYTDECTWFHTIGDDNGRNLCNSEGLYIRLDLRSQNLVGTLPSEIALLSDHLRKWNGRLMIKSAHHCSRLTTPLLSVFIHLYDNQIQGTVPTELGLLSKLGRWYHGSCDKSAVQALFYIPTNFTRQPLS